MLYLQVLNPVFVLLLTVFNVLATFDRNCLYSFCLVTVCNAAQCWRLKEERCYIIFIYGQILFPLGYQQIFDDVMKNCYCYFCCILQKPKQHTSKSIRSCSDTLFKTEIDEIDTPFKTKHPENHTPGSKTHRGENGGVT